jgi:hypothetical protein
MRQLSTVGLIVVGAIVATVLIACLPGIQRYLRISTM